MILKEISKALQEVQQPQKPEIFQYRKDNHKLKIINPQEVLCNNKVKR